MHTLKKIRDHQKAFLKKTKARKESLAFFIEGVNIIVNPGVFPPATDTKLLASHIHITPGERILDLTTGSGIFSIIAGLQGATGIAVDINPVAVSNASENIATHRVQIKAIQSDLFTNVPDEQFDQIFANGPFIEGIISDPLDYACYGAKAFLKGLFSGVRKRLKSTGKLLIVMSEWSDLNYFFTTIKSNNLRPTLIAIKDSEDGERRYRLYEIIP